jgi:peptidoglycan/xylan/chitin deacetylase (PgdA/CDA1 family)
MPTPDGPDADPVLPPSRRLALGAGAALGAGVVLGAAGCSGPEPTASASSRATGTGAATSSSAAATTTGVPSTTSGATGPAPRPSVASVRGADIVSGPAGREEVALTFHGQGSAALTKAVQAACAEADARITVFAVGTWVDADPSLARGLRDAGHELGNHTWSHQQMPQLGATTAASEVRRGRDALARAVGDAGWWFRPSGTRRSTPTIRSAAQAAGYARCVSYDVDPEDFLDPGARAVRTRVRKAVRGGSIVSLHLGHAGTAEALPGILTDLRSIGLAPVTLSRLLRD